MRQTFGQSRLSEVRRYFVGVGECEGLGDGECEGVGLGTGLCTVVARALLVVVRFGVAIWPGPTPAK